MAYLGENTTTPNGSIPDLAANEKRVQRYTALSSGFLSSGQIRCGGSTSLPSVKYRLVVYSDGQNNSYPDLLLAVSDEIEMTLNQTLTLYPMTFAEKYKKIKFTKGKNYWIGLIASVGSSGAVVSAQNSTVKTTVYNTDVYGANPNGRFGAFTNVSYSAMQLCVFYNEIQENLKHRKRFVHKIYNGNTYVGTIPDQIILSQPNYSWVINGGLGEMTIDLGLTVQDFQNNYENASIKFGYRIKTFIQGANESAATQIYDGLISSYDPTIDENGNEMIRLRILSQVSSLNSKMLKSGSATEVAYSSQDPSNILKDVIDKYAGAITYSSDSVALTGTTVSYTYNFSTCLEAINKALELCPAYWFWRVNPDSTIYLKKSNFEAIDHRLYIGKHVKSINARKSIDNLANSVYFRGGGSPPLYKLYQRLGSVSEYGLREYRISDERVTTAATALLIANKYLDENDHPISVVTIEVFDDAYDTSAGYDIESIKVGDVVQLLHPYLQSKVSLWSDGSSGATWDIDFWDYDIRYSLGLPMQVHQIDYKFDRVVVQLTAKVEEVQKRIEDIDRNLDVIRSEGMPTTPS